MSSTVKTIIGTNLGNQPFSCEFSSVEFTRMTGYATLQGPLSIALSIGYSQIAVGVYIGLKIETIEGTIYVADRTHIAFLPQLQPGTPQGNVTITSRSVPSLARIDGTLTKITILFDGLIDLSTTQFDVTLTVNSPSIISVPSPYIGKDSSIVNGSIVVNDATVTVPNGAINFAITSILVPAYCRLRVHSFMVWIQHTAAIATLDGLVRIQDPSGSIKTILRIDSETTRRVYHFGTFPSLILPAFWKISIEAINNSGAAAAVIGSIVGEYIL